MHFADPVRKNKGRKKGSGRDQGLLTRQALLDKKVFPILSVIIQPAPIEHSFATTEQLPSSRGSALKGTAGEIRLDGRQSGQTYDALPKRQAREGGRGASQGDVECIRARIFSLVPSLNVSFEKR